MLKESKWQQYGQEGLDIKGVVLHNTNNYDMSAREIFDYLDNECKTSQGVHFLIDHNEIIECMPLTWKVWSTGKGNDYAFNHMIAIEVVSNLNDELYMQGQNKAVSFIKELMEQYNFSKENIKFHNDYDKQTYCPSNILQKYKTRKIFIEEEFE